MKKLFTFLSLVLISALVFVFFTKPAQVKAATDVESTVPEASMVNLAWDEESGYTYVTDTANTVVKYLPLPARPRSPAPADRPARRRHSRSSRSS